MKDAELAEYALRGYHIERSAFSREEAATMLEHYMERRKEGPKPGDFGGVKTRTKTEKSDPLDDYPRFIQMHQWDDLSLQWATDPRLTELVSAMMGEPAVLMQTMVYFKPPGSRGQSFHQDCLYLRLTPIVAAWVALDRCDRENGAMEMVRRSHLLGLLPREEADTDLSFTDDQTVMPKFLQKDLIDLEPGDAVFFHGMTIHGSMPNETTDRFRRSFICHYHGETTFPLGAPATLPK